MIREIKRLGIFHPSLQLEETVAFGPFVQELIALFNVASRTGHNQIINVIRSSSTQRNNMIYVVKVFASIFLQFVSAIIASISLPFQLFLNLCESVASLCTHLACSAFMIRRTNGGSSFFRSIMPSFSFGDFFPVFKLVPSVIFSFVLTMFFDIFQDYLPATISVILSTFFTFTRLAMCMQSIFVRLLPMKELLRRREPLFTDIATFQSFEKRVFFSGRFSTSSTPTFLANRIQTVSRCPSDMKELLRRRENPFARKTTFQSFGKKIIFKWRLSARSVATFLAHRMQTVPSCSSGRKVFSSSRKELFALRTLLLRGVFGYSGIHDRLLYSLSSRRRVLQVPLWQHHLSPSIIPQCRSSSNFTHLLSGGFYA